MRAVPASLAKDSIKASHGETDTAGDSKNYVFTTVLLFFLRTMFCIELTTLINVTLSLATYLDGLELLI